MSCKKWTYGGDPSKSTQDAVRFLVGDTFRERPLLDDREVQFILTQTSNLNIAAAMACEALWSRFLAISDYTVGSVSKKFSDVAEKFKVRAVDFRNRATERALVSFPSTLVSTKRNLEADQDLENPQFAIGMADSPLAIQLNDELGDLWRTRGW